MLASLVIFNKRLGSGSITLERIRVWFQIVQSMHLELDCSFKAREGSSLIIKELYESRLSLNDPLAYVSHHANNFVCSLDSLPRYADIALARHAFLHSMTEIGC